MLAASVHAATGDTITAKVVSVHDGDTIYVEAVGRVFKVRLWGIDSPELRQPSGDNARWFTTEIALDRTVRLTEMGVDRYGRVVAIVTLSNGRVLNEALLQAGHAWWYAKYAPEKTEYGQMQDEAKHGSRGLWSQGDALTPWEWRKVRYPVEVTPRTHRRSAQRH